MGPQVMESCVGLGVAESLSSTLGGDVSRWLNLLARHPRLDIELSQKPH